VIFVKLLEADASREIELSNVCLHDRLILQLDSLSRARISLLLSARSLIRLSMLPSSPVSGAWAFDSVGWVLGRGENLGRKKARGSFLGPRTVMLCSSVSK